MGTTSESSVNQNRWQKIAPFAILSLVSFLAGVGLLCVMLWNAERLTALGLAGDLYYIVLLPLGLSAAAFLFGVFQSYARYTGKQAGGKLELGGPVVGFALVVIGGFFLPKPPQDLSVTVLVHGEAGTFDLVLRNFGVVWIKLDDDLRHEVIGDKGQADFKNIPTRFRGQAVQVSVVADGFEMLNPKQTFPLGSGAVDVTIRRKAVHLSGTVQDTEGNPVNHATIQVGEERAVVDSTGHFNLTLPSNDGSIEIKAAVIAPGYEPWQGQFTPGAGDAQIQLRKTH
jgi:uncharacterized membrane protein YiaA